MRPLIPLLVVFAILANAQTIQTMALRGIVLEVGPNTPLPDAQITIYEIDPGSGRKPFASLRTDSRGSFDVKVERPGTYYIEASKPEYVGAGDPLSHTDLVGSGASPITGVGVKLSADHRTEEVRFALIRYGRLSGKIVDDDGKPISRLTVELLPAKRGSGAGVWFPAVPVRWTTFTAADGTFQIPKIIPGPYLVRVSTSGVQLQPPVALFSEEDAQAVDPAFETTYWPNAADQASAAASTVSPGATNDLGTMRVRKSTHYRARFRPQGCEPGDQLRLSAKDQEGPLLDPLSVMGLERGKVFPCQDLLIRDIQPGSYRFLASTKHSSAVGDFSISNKNQLVVLTLVPNGPVLVSVSTAANVPVPTGPLLLMGGGKLTNLVPKSSMALSDMRCGPLQASLTVLQPGYYVKDVLVNGASVVGDELNVCGGSRIEILLDNKVSSLNVSLSDGDKPVNEATLLVQKWPKSPLDFPQLPAPNPSGTRQLTDLAPGQYRILALRNFPVPDNGDIKGLAAQLWDRATTVTLAPGEAKSISVKLIDPFQ